jgi:hypothetical protein
MRELKTFLSRCLLLWLFIVAASLMVAAQSTIFNIPSTDVLDEKRLYVEGDLIAHFDKWEKGGFQTYGYRMVYGLRPELEVGVNFFYTRNGNTAPKELQLNAKYKVFSREKWGFAVSSGAQIFVPLNRSAGRRAFGMFYSNASKIVKRTRETRLTGGFFTVFGAERGFGTKNGALIGVEQPLTEKLTFTADWYSGKNRFGYAAAGFAYSFAKRHYIQVGYNWGNAGRGNNSLTALYGFTF